jgi:hypothetical protein
VLSVYAGDVPLASQPRAQTFDGGPDISHISHDHALIVNDLHQLEVGDGSQISVGGGVISNHQRIDTHCECCPRCLTGERVREQ